MKSGYEFVMSERAQLGEHLGEWIAVVGDGIVASGDDVKVVYKKSITEHPNEIPLIMKVPKETVMLL